MRTIVLAGFVGLLPAAVAAQPISPRTLLPLHAACADLPVPTAATATLTVAGAQRADGRQVLGIGDMAVLRAGTAQGLAVGQQFVARRLDGGREAFRRGTKGFAGVRTAGVLEITAVDANFAIARVSRACDHVRVGDYLEPLALQPIPAPAAAGAPNFADRATVLFGRDLQQMFGDGDILAIDRGTAQGVTPGSRFAIYRDPRNGLPLTELGEAVVIDAGDNWSRAVVQRAFDVITGGDVAVLRGAAQP